MSDSLVNEARRQYEENGLCRFVCPACLGGSDHEDCASIWENDDGEILVTCHRATCLEGTQSVFKLGTGERRYAKHLVAQKARVLSEFDRSLWHNVSEPTGAFIRKFMDKHPILDWRNIRYFMRAHGIDGYRVAIRDWDGALRGVIIRPNQEGLPKSLTYKDKDYSGVAVFGYDKAHEDTVYVVEDVISAMCLSSAGKVAVALNGTSLGWDRLAELLNHRWKIVLMLDADATSKAIRYSVLYGPDVVKVRRLVKDIKDMTQDEFDELMAS